MLWKRSEIFKSSLQCTDERIRRNAWLYDSVLKISCLPFGGEGRFRQAFVDFATIAEGDQVLDACCGTGTLTSLLAEKVGRLGTVTGIDHSRKLLEKATRKAHQSLPLTFLQGKCKDMPFPDGNFNKVFVSFGMHEIAEVDRLNSLREMHRVLTDSGSLFIFEYHLARSTLGRFIVMVFHRLFEDEGAYRMLLRGTLIPQLEQVGFVVKRKQLIGFGIFQMLQAVKI